MKYVSPYRLLLFSMVLLTACGKNKDSVTPSLVGKWQVLTVMTTVSNKSVAATQTENYSGKDASYEFQSDGTFTSRAPDSTSTGIKTTIETGTYKLSGNSITLTVQDPSTKVSTNNYATYGLSGSSLTFTVTKDLLLKSLNEQLTTDPGITQLVIAALNTYDVYTVTVNMQRQ